MTLFLQQEFQKDDIPLSLIDVVDVSIAAATLSISTPGG